MEKIQELEQKIELVKKEIEDENVKQGNGYRCIRCGAYNRYTLSDPYDHHKSHNELKLCYKCWSKDIIEDKRKSILELLNNSMVVDIKMVDNPYLDNTFKSIIIKYDSIKYKIYYDGDYLRLLCMK